ncbi:MAG: nucleotide exchange factor GrpE [Pseudolabrys sp.]|nr:nucleotide exchange factor GrpE [Pseudolabrys sp.]MDP2297505.1 nucleotide exchange factor GrpE [Pseudolabrys sp.]
MTDKPANDTVAKDSLPEGEAPVVAAAPELVPAEQVTAALEAAAEFKDKHLRLLAEMENLRRRTEREVADARQYGIAGFARDVLAVADNMHRALATLDEEVRGAADAKLMSLIEGVELTERELLKTLEKNGVKKFTPQGEKFDPNLHQAMYEVPHSDVPAGHVAQVIQSGYMIGERMLRPALVGVSKPAAKAASN